jgi:hypothetical protein
MKTKYKLLSSALLLAVGLVGGFCPEADAAEFNPLIGNPFLFCSSPRPCKYCQPYRRIYGEICDSQDKARKDANSNNIETSQEFEARNRALTVARFNVIKQEGADALAAALERGDTIFPMNENTSDLSFNAFAAGWNSEWMKRRALSE